jgi:hypothetical protein
LFALATRLLGRLVDDFYHAPHDLLQAVKDMRNEAKEAKVAKEGTYLDNNNDSSPQYEDLETFCAAVRKQLNLSIKEAPEQYEDELLNLLLAPQDSELHSLAKTLVRIENLSHILCWATKLSENDLYCDSKQYRFNCDRVELPRLNLTFIERDGKLYSLDHSSLFVSNIRNARTSDLIAGLPHGLILQDGNNEIHILVPSLRPMRPTLGPFSTDLVFDRTATTWINALDTRYYLYPAHISLSFLFCQTLPSTLYLLLLHFLYRDYTKAFALAESVAVDYDFSQEESNIFQAL